MKYSIQSIAFTIFISALIPLCASEGKFYGLYKTDIIPEPFDLPFMNNEGKSDHINVERVLDEKGKVVENLYRVWLSEFVIETSKNGPLTAKLVGIYHPWQMIGTKFEIRTPNKEQIEKAKERGFDVSRFTAKTH